MLERKIEYWDSLGFSGVEVMSHIAWYLDDHAADQLLGPINAKNFDRVTPYDIPRQKDDFNCGIFTIAYADYRALGRNMTFSALDIGKYRKKVAQEILIG